jgi:hypothetical protein
MGKSFKNVICCKSYKRSARLSKRRASRAIRNSQITPSTGGNFKKLFSAWDIYDYKAIYIQEEKILDLCDDFLLRTPSLKKRKKLKHLSLIRR